jgi:hypothetical protein
MILLILIRSFSLLTGDDAQYCFQVGLSIKSPLTFFVKQLVPLTAEIPMIGRMGQNANG